MRLRLSGAPGFVAAALLCAAFAAPRAEALPSFDPMRSFDAGCPVRVVRVADVTGDGIPDILALSSFTTGRLRILQGLGGGAFGSPLDDTLAGSHMVTGDFDKDGRVDIAATLNGLTVLRNLGGGVFAAPVQYSLPSGSTGLDVGDVNGDGIDDIVVTGSAYLSVFPGRAGNPLGTRVDRPLDRTSIGVRVGRVNDDSHLDVVAFEVSGDYVWAQVFMNAGGGALAAQGIDFLGQGSVTGGPDVGDFDGDGKLDVVALFYGNLVWIETGNGSRFDGSQTQDSGESEGFGLKAGDLDGDGRSDVAIGGKPAASVWIMGSQGSSLSSAVGYSTAGTALGPVRDVAIADVNADGLPDIVTADESTQSVTVLLQNSGVTAVPHAPAGRIPALTLDHVWPTVASDRLNLSFSLPARGEAEIDLFDLGGRRLLSHRLGALEAGSYERTVPIDASVPAGVVWVRVKQGGASAAARAVVAR